MTVDPAAVEPLGPDFFERPVETVARELIGTQFLIDGVGGAIVETEAYDPQDPAAHTFRGPTSRNAAMFGPAGRAYVYRSYGIHWCVNFTCGNGAGVLIRALVPQFGIDTMRERRGLADIRLLCAGPGRLCQALGIDASFGSLPLDQPPFALGSRSSEPPITACPRIGISVAKDTPWRFCATGSPFLSRPAVP
jgi:DNA-3-methyladenine glycosylase